MRRAITAGGLCALWLALFTLGSCTGNGNGSELNAAALTGGGEVELSTPAAAEDASQLPHFPAPQTLIGDPQRSLSYLPADLREEAENHSVLLPVNRTTATASGAIFDPEWTSGEPFSNLAYAAYHFEIEGYDLNPQIKFGWTAAPNQGQLWVALSDWEQNRWMWYRPASDSLSLNLASLAPFIGPGGDMYVVVLLTGTAPCELDWLRAGSAPPLASLTVTGPRAAFGELATSFDASASVDPDGSIVKYEWDWNGDGSFDSTSGSNPEAEHTFSEAGSFNVAVRVTDDQGVRASASKTVSVASEWSHSVGGSRNESIQDIASAPDGTLWACGYVDTTPDDNFTSEMMLLHYAADGELLREIYHRSDPSTSTVNSAERVEIDSEGNIFILGSISIPGHGGPSLQRRSSEGELVWLRSFSGVKGRLSQLRLIGETIYLCGGDHDQTLNAERGIYAAVDKDGQELLSFLSQESASFTDVTYFSSGSPLNSGYRFCGYSRDSLSEHDLLYMLVPSDGSARQTMTWGSAEYDEFGVSIRLIGSQLAPAAIIGARFQGTFGDDLHAGAVKVGSSAAQRSSEIAGSTQCSDATALGSRSFLLARNNQGLAMIFEYNSNPAFTQSYSYTTPLSSGICISQYAGEALLVGGSTGTGGGDFSGDISTLTVDVSNTWTDYPLIFDSYPLEWQDMTLANFADRPPGVQDSGGGFSDAWVSLHVPPPAAP